MGAAMPARSAVRARCRSSTPVTGTPSKVTSRSPVCRPACLPGPSGARSDTMTPVGWSSPWKRRTRVVIGTVWADRPRRERRTLPSRIRRVATQIGGVDADGEADPLRRGDNRGVDADHAAGAGDEGAAGIAGVERRVGLDDAVEEASAAGAQGATERADDPGGDGAGKTEGIADGDDELADLEGRGCAKLGVRQPCSGQAQHGDVGGRIVTDEGGLEALAIGDAGVEAGGAGDHVAVGQDVAVRGEDHSRSRPAGRPTLVKAVTWTTAGPTRSKACTTWAEYGSSSWTNASSGMEVFLSMPKWGVCIRRGTRPSDGAWSRSSVRYRHRGNRRTVGPCKEGIDAWI